MGFVIGAKALYQDGTEGDDLAELAVPSFRLENAPEVMEFLATQTAKIGTMRDRQRWTPGTPGGLGRYVKCDAVDLTISEA